MSKEEREHAKEESEAMDMIFTGYELLLKSDKILGGYSCSLLSSINSKYLPRNDSLENYEETLLVEGSGL